MPDAVCILDLLPDPEQKILNREEQSAGSDIYQTAIRSPLTLCCRSEAGGLLFAVNGGWQNI